MVFRIASFLLLLAAFAFAQLTPNSVTVTASRNTSAQPDQVVFQITVDAPADTSRDDVVAALQGAGITLANFSSVRTVQLYNPQGQQTQTLLEWTFSLPVEIADMKSAIGLLSAVQKSNAEKNNSLTISFGVSGTQVSTQAQQSQTCSVADLLSDARAQAQKMASAAGASVGSVLAISGATSSSSVASGTAFTSAIVSPVCSLTVKFTLGGGF